MNTQTHITNIIIISDSEDINEKCLEDVVVVNRHPHASGGSPIFPFWVRHIVDVVCMYVLAALVHVCRCDSDVISIGHDLYWCPRL